MEAAEHDETEKKGGFKIGFSETKGGSLGGYAVWTSISRKPSVFALNVLL